ncbi:MAG: 50S ribosome-binding GTPase [Phycisphaerales bacterium]|nr:50S ribosome-binding GTPase [Phycisphaerales bacterium]
MTLGDTIVARASAPGAGRRAIVRVSGSHCVDALRAVGIDEDSQRAARPAMCAVPVFADAVHRAASTSFPIAVPASRQQHRPQHESRTRLPVLLLTFEQGRSYTGESSAELHLPNCRPLIERLIDCMCALPGVRRAEPGEFTARAYLAGRLTLAQAEGVAAKISAESERQLEAADRLLAGRAGDDYRAWSDEIASLLALVEAGIDFVDQEDVTPIHPAVLHARLESLIASIEPLLGSSPAPDWGAARPLVVLTGPPNAGKSTLFNALLGRTRAVTSPISGTTRDAIIEPLNLHDVAGPSVDLADLPGLDASPAGSLEHAMRQRALDVIARADVVIACDPSGRFDHPSAADTPTLRVRTKADEHLPAPEAGVSVCALDGWHLPSLRRAIAEQCASVRRDDDALLIPRHRQVVVESLACLREASTLARAQPEGGLREAEFISLRLREALDRLGELAGAITPDAIIGRIFATFCIGK